MDLEDILDQYAEARAARDRAQLRLDDVQRQLLEAMKDNQAKVAERQDKDGNTWRATYTVRNTTVIDEKGLRKALRAAVFDKYTKKTLDKRAMERAMETGEVDPTVVARFVQQKPGQPFLTYNQIQTNGDDDA